MTTTLSQIRAELKKHSDPKQAKNLQRFFKTGKGEYGEGDRFLGLKVPAQRKIAARFRDISLKDTIGLLHSSIHEHRLTALFILVGKYKKADEAGRKEIYTSYLKNTRYINNWDLVDSSAPHIVGNYLLDKDRKVLYRLARSRDLWERRISVLATFAFIMAGQLEDVFAIAEILLKDNHDLIHKAVGWMLREAGKRVSQDEEENFLQKHYRNMPRTMLRYAIERFDDRKRKFYMKKPS
ncbi:DNA alkylation repair protein [Fibrobacterota bacterium]